MLTPIRVCVKGLSCKEMSEGIPYGGKTVDCKRKIDIDSLISGLVQDFGERCTLPPSATHGCRFTGICFQWRQLCWKIHLLCLD